METRGLGQRIRGVRRSGWEASPILGESLTRFGSVMPVGFDRYLLDFLDLDAAAFEQRCVTRKKGERNSHGQVVVPISLGYLPRPTGLACPARLAIPIFLRPFL